MEENITNSEKISEIIDRIFLLNHNIINLILASYRDSNLKRVPVLNNAVEKMAFDKLSECFEELRDTMREAIEIGDEINQANVNGIYGEETANEIIYQSRERTKESLIKAMKDRLQGLFVSMNFVPIVFTREAGGSKEVVESVYEGLPEESLRAQEYSSLESALEKQVQIIEYEDYFEKHEKEEAFTISPFISPELMNAIAARSKYKLAEEQCKRFAEESREQEDVFDEYPELKEVTEFSEYLMLQEKYKAGMERAAGLLNNRTTYGKFFFHLYETDKLTFYTGFSQSEINTRINGQVGAYSERNKQIIRQEFDAAVERYKSVRVKRNIKDLSASLKNSVKGRISRMRKNYKRKPESGRKVIEMKEKNPEEPNDFDGR